MNESSKAEDKGLAEPHRTTDNPVFTLQGTTAVTDSKSILTFRGVRGSMPVSGADMTRHGGNTLCIDVTAGDRSVVLIDGGTGIARLNQDLTAAKPTEYHVSSLITTGTTYRVCCSSGHSSTRTATSLSTVTNGTV